MQKESRIERLHLSSKMKKSMSDDELSNFYNRLRISYSEAEPCFDIEKSEKNYRRLAGVFRLFSTLKKTVVLEKQLVPSDEGYIFVANHIGSFDQFYITSLLDKRALHYLIKEKVTTWPIRWNFIYKPTGVVVINPESRHSWINAKKDLISLLLRNKNVFIFPEGTRRGPDNIGDFNSGVAQIAQESGKKIVTLAIKNSSSMFSKRSIICMGEIIEVGPREDIKQATEKVKASVLRTYANILAHEEILV